MFANVILDGLARIVQYLVLKDITAKTARNVVNVKMEAFVDPMMASVNVSQAGLVLTVQIVRILFVRYINEGLLVLFIIPLKNNGFSYFHKIFRVTVLVCL